MTTEKKTPIDFASMPMVKVSAPISKIAAGLEEMLSLGARSTEQVPGLKREREYQAQRLRFEQQTGELERAKERWERRQNASDDKEGWGDWS